jgi:hypothetical protein
LKIPIFLRKIVEGISDWATKTIANVLIIFIMIIVAIMEGAAKVLRKLLILMFNKYLVTISLIDAAFLFVVLAEVDEFDDIRVSDVGPIDEMCVISLHLVFCSVLDLMLIDEFLRNGVAISVPVHFQPVLHDQTRFLWQAISHLTLN